MMQQNSKLEDALFSCNRCGLCHACSPLMQVQHLESSTARGKIWLARCYVQGNVEATQTLIDRLYECLLCGHCSKVCPAGIKVEEVMQSTRRILASAGKAPSTIRRIISNIDLTGNIYGEDVADKPLRDDSDLIYFPGCVSSIKHRGLAEAVLQSLSKARVEVEILEGACCGAPAWAAGYHEVFEKRCESLQAILEGREVITNCPHCQYFLRRLRNVKVRHVSQIYVELLNEGRLQPRKGSVDTVTYSDPCYLTRFLSIVDEPRRVISSIPGLRLVEMESNKENTKCCGNGFELVQNCYPDLASRLAGNRLNEALKTEARTVVTSCPHCYLTLSEVAEQTLKQLKIIDLSQLLSYACLQAEVP
ncbi:MAG: (Fe-S)-binding protein [Candidatus Bathyarchaeia archaeon]